MTANDRIATDKKGDAVTAQLALAADESGRDEAGKGGSCLSNDQLAAIATGTCTPEEKEQALAHFAECKKCYDALVAISFSIATVERSGSQSRSASMVRSLTWLGSAFAIAASVVVFFNIREVPREADQQGFAPPGSVVEQSAVESKPAPQAMSDSVRKNIKPAQKRAMPEALSMEEERAKAPPQEAVQPQELERWMSDIASACISKSDDRDEWLRLRIRGTSIVASLADSDRSSQLEKIVRLLPKNGDTPSPPQCSQIFTLLAEQAQWE